MKQIIKKRFDIIINEAKQTVKEQFELDKNVTRITGLLLTSDKRRFMDYRGSQNLKLIMKNCT